MSKQSPELLETLLSKGVVWRGRAQDAGFAHEETLVSTRIDSLDQGLAGGWPNYGGVELCVSTSAVEWYLLAKQLARVTNDGKIGVLINPPHELMACKLMNDHIQLANLWIVETQGNADFVASTVECLRTHSCGVVAAWEPKGMQYVHLRKCLMACTDNAGLFFLIRNVFARRNASPAVLRLMLKLQQNSVEVEIFKQKGLVEPKTLHIDLPPNLLPKMPIKLLGSKQDGQTSTQRKPGNIVRFGRRPALNMHNRLPLDRF